MLNLEQQKGYFRAVFELGWVEIMQGREQTQGKVGTTVKVVCESGLDPCHFARKC